MSDNLLFQTQSREIPSIAMLADCTFSSKAIKECFKDFQDPKISLDAELNHLREQHRKTLIELSKSNALNKDLKAELNQLERKILQKDREISELKSQCDLKSCTSRRLQEIDLNLPRLPVKSSMDENAGEGRSIKQIADYERTVKKLTSQNKSLKKELEALTDALRKYEDNNKGKDSHDYYQKLAQELSHQLKVTESAQDQIEKENEHLKKKVEKLNGETSQLKKDGVNLKKNYEDLKERYESLEITMSNKADYSTESGANSETTGGSNAPNSKRSLKKDVKWNLEGMNLTIQGRDSSDFGREEYRKIVHEVMDIYKVKNPLEIIPSVKKMEKVIHMVPKLRKVVSDVATIVFPRVGYSPEKHDIELIIPSLKKLVKEIDEAELLNSLRNKLIEVLQLEKDCSNIEIVKKVDKLATLTYQKSESKEQNPDGLENSLLSAQFMKIFGTQPSTTVFRQINKQIEDFKHFMSVIKYKLKLEVDIKSDSCMNQILKILDSGVKEKQAAEVVHKIQGMLDCSTDSIVHIIDRMLFDKKRKDKTYGPHDY